MPTATEQLSQPTEAFIPEIRAYEALQLSTEYPVDLSERGPLLSAEEAESMFGFPTGPLQAIIRMPAKHGYGASVDPTAAYVDKHEGLRKFGEQGRAEYARRRDAVSVFCFKSEPKGRHHRTDAYEPRFHLMGIEQIQQLRDAARGGVHDTPEVGDGILELTPGRQAQIGRASWLPGIGREVTLLQNDPSLRDRYQSVSRYQVRVSENTEGHMFVVGDTHESNSYKNDGLTDVEVGRPLGLPRVPRGRLRTFGSALLRRAGKGN